MSQDYTPRLQTLMQPMGFSSFRALSQAAGVSEKQIRRLRRGELAPLRVETLLKLSQALQISLPDLLITLTSPTPHPSPLTPHSPPADPNSLQQEYDRLQHTLAQQKQDLWQEFQQSSLQILESLLLQFPTAAYAAQQNPQAPAVKLLPLVLRPLEQLLQAWEIEAIAAVADEIAYDPQQHQLMEGTAQPGDRVRVRYTGYRQAEKLLYRAKVSPIAKG